MKNVKFLYVVLLFLLYMVICFFMPTIINGNFSNFIKEKEFQGDIKEVNQYSGDKIKLFITENNSVIELSIEEYLKGVLLGEVPITYELDALKAQAVVARTYTLNKLKNTKGNHELGADMCDNINCCQAYKTKEYALASWDDEEEEIKWSKLEEAVESTSGEIILYSGELINAFFHAHSGGKTENVKNIWSKEEIPYLVSVSGNESYIYQDSKTFNKEEFANLIKSEVVEISGDFDVEIKDYTGSGRVNTLVINDKIVEATKLRSLIGIRSTNFRIEESGDNFTFYTVGYGHGVGMSQEGANQMALEGKSYVDIIKHYYSGVEISKINS